MGQETRISWCDATWSPWRGCSKVSAGCANCYAEALSKRNPSVLGTWGENGTRVIAAEPAWRMPLRWNRQAKETGKRLSVFPSLCDPFEEREQLDRVLARLLKLIHMTPQLDWLLLTKRPELIEYRLERATNCRPTTQDEEDGAELASQWRIGCVMPNIWLGVSVENQEWADKRIPHLLQIPASVRFLSCEPLLGPINLACDKCRSSWGSPDPSDWFDCMGDRKIDWIIIGGESGPHHRPMEIDWLRSLVRQCRAASVSCLVKQDSHRLPGQQGCIPADLWDVKEFPKGS